jgi:hypothetical protein
MVRFGIRILPPAGNFNRVQKRHGISQQFIFRLQPPNIIFDAWSAI